MAEIKPMALIESMRKKVCMHSDVYFRTNKQTGKTTTGKLCYPSAKAPSAAQIKAKKPNCKPSTKPKPRSALSSATQCTNSTATTTTTAIPLTPN